MVNKVIIFDLDETLGYFTEMSVFWNIITKINKHRIDFFDLLDLFPEIFRPGIMDILKYIKYKKQSHICKSVIIYTNNQGPNSWSKMIAYYFNYKLKFKLFDKVIGRYDKNSCRTSKEKIYTDIKKCLNIKTPTKICFIDNLLHSRMVNENVVYIYINSFKYLLTYKVMAERYCTNIGTNIDKTGFFYKFNKLVKKYKKINIENACSDIDKESETSKKLLLCIKKFLYT